MSVQSTDRPSAVLARMRAEILAAAERHRASNVRVFGSIDSGADTASSDVDLLVHFSAEASLYDQVNLIAELEERLAFAAESDAYVVSLGEQHFYDDRPMQLVAEALTHRIGEAVGRLPDTFVEAHQHVA